MITKKSEDAVSPVIGIMLLVVVTVIIAAVITAFATGVVGSTEPAPVAALDVEILNSENTLSDLKGPELFITHRSGDAVDTKDIELRFSWVCGLDDCENGGVHYSTYSADGFVKEHPNGIDSNEGKRYQALYVKSTMTVERDEYKSTGINHYFGDVILTPGLKLTASSELLNGYENTNSQFMEMVFNEYVDSIVQGTEETVDKSDCISGTYHDYVNCGLCNPGGYGMFETVPEWDMMLVAVYNLGKTVDVCSEAKAHLYCAKCGLHIVEDCTDSCACRTIIPGTPGSDGIMEHLQPGTAVDVMIVHLPSDKAIFDKTVIVQ